jgi:dTDP-4-dehydrorhamnose reductase
MLGHKMFQHLREYFSGTICTLHQNSADQFFERIPLFRGNDVLWGIDALDFARVRAELRRVQPEYLINCIGMVKQRKEATSPITAITLNSLFPHRLAELCGEWGGRLIHISTDCVFSGRRGMYTENDLSDAEDLYGKTKFLGEATEINSLTIRTSIIGRELSRHQALLDWFLFQTDGRVSGYRKAIYSGVTTNHLAEVTANVIQKWPKLQGLYQLASAPISKYDLLSLVRDAYSLKITIDAVDGEIADRSLDCSKFSSETGYHCPPWPELVRQLVSDPTPYREWLGSPV